MKPPYKITPSILALISKISEKIGEVNASFILDTSPKLRKQNAIKTIQSSLQIEGNTLSEKQITAIIENKRVIGPPVEIREVKNAINVYQHIKEFRYESVKSFLSAHRMMMAGLIDKPGEFRKKSVGIARGKEIEHIAPPANKTRYLMNDLFSYLKSKDEIDLIKSCVFHYELEFIHPFVDGNGRMGRLWQTVILMNSYPVFQFIPFETLISKSQSEYYKALSDSDKSGSSTVFIEYMLDIINHALSDILKSASGKVLNQDARIKHFTTLRIDPFTRKDYMKIFKNISTATASRDLKIGIEKGLWKKHGDKRLASYKFM
jgi:Fic family protein